MNYRIIANIIGRSLCVEAVFLLPAYAISLCYLEYSVAEVILCCAFVTAAIGGLLLLCKGDKSTYRAREGILTVGLAWVVLSLFGALPFYCSGAIPNYLDSVFETISGFTTTGASILADVEALPKGLLYWRSFTHWLGGMGVLVFLLALQPTDKGKGQSMFLMRAESPGPEVSKLVPKMQKSAKILYGIYIGLTVLQIIMQALGGMHWFDNITTAFGTAGTGGFAIRSDSLASYGPYIQGVVTVFMVLFGINFNAFFLLLSGKIGQVLRGLEVRVYLLTLLGSTLLIAANILPQMGDFWQSLHHAAFQTTSIMTTTGFASVDFNQWPEFSKTILLILMVVGACAGSTGGGIKVSRVILMCKGMRKELRQSTHPHEVSVIRMDGKIVSDATMRGVWMYMTAYVAVLGASLLLVSTNGFGLESSFSGVMACLNNIGPGFGVLGPASSFASCNALSKVVLCLDMLIGRLEIFPILMLFSPSFWARKSY